MTDVGCIIIEQSSSSASFHLAVSFIIHSFSLINYMSGIGNKVSRRECAKQKENNATSQVFEFCMKIWPHLIIALYNNTSINITSYTGLRSSGATRYNSSITKSMTKTNCKRKRRMVPGKAARRSGKVSPRFCSLMNLKFQAHARLYPIVSGDQICHLLCL